MAPSQQDIATAARDGALILGAAEQTQKQIAMSSLEILTSLLVAPVGVARRPLN
jgi:hypothetical protein